MNKPKDCPLWKLILLWGVVGFGLIRVAHADTTPIVGPGPAPTVVPTTTPAPVYYHLGPLNLTVPWDQVNAVYLYDLNAKRNLMGGEAVVATLWKLQGTLGAVTSIDGKGAPYIGGNFWLPNPVQQLAILNTIQPGIFGGYDWNRGSAIWGFKAAISLF